MRLIDADELKKEWRMGDVCEMCDQDTRQCGNDYCFSRMDVCGMIDDTPTVNGWISVKDDLPEEHVDEHTYEFEQYLCATVWNDVQIVGFGTRIGDDKQHFWYGNSIWDDWVTHWMPLPEPPKEEN